MLDNFQTLIPDNSLVWEYANEQASGERWDADVDIVRRFKDPWTCPPHLLNFLAFEHSVDIWDENWPELKKRSVIASSLADHRIKGTLAGTRRYVEIAGGTIQQVVRRPQGFAVSRNLTKEEQDAWVAKHPKIRLTLSQGNGSYARKRGVFVGHSSIGSDWLKINEGRALYGRKAFLTNNGVDTPLLLSEVVSTEGDRVGQVVERLVIPGRSNRGSIVGRMSVGSRFVGSAGKNPQVYTFSFDHSYVYRDSALALTTVAAGFEPRDIRSTRESAEGVAGGRLFVGQTAVGRNAIGRNRAPWLLADVIYLNDPSIDVPRVKARSFVGYTRISMPHHQADLLIDWKRKIDMRRRFVVGNSAIKRQPINGLSTGHREFMLAAIASSKRLSDKVRVSFQTTRERTLAIGAPLDGSVLLGDRTHNRL